MVHEMVSWPFICSTGGECGLLGSSSSRLLSLAEEEVQVCLSRILDEVSSRITDADE